MKYILKTKLIEPDDGLTVGNGRKRETEDPFFDLEPE